MFLRMGYGKKLIGRGEGQRLFTQAERKQKVFDRGGSARLLNRERSILSRVRKG